MAQLLKDIFKEKVTNSSTMLTTLFKGLPIV